MNPDHLRPATRSQNCANKSTSASSGRKGVHWYARTNRWTAKIKVDQRTIHLGYFHDPEEAAAAYRLAALEHFGEFAHA